MPYPHINRPWHKRLRQSLDSVRRRPLKHDAVDARAPRPPPPVPNTPKICEARDDDHMNVVRDDGSNETNRLDRCQPSDELDQNKSSSLSEDMASDVIVEDSVAKDTTPTTNRSSSNLTVDEEIKAETEVEAEGENKKRDNDEEHEEVETSPANQLNEDDEDIRSLTGENATVLATDLAVNEGDMIRSESSLSNLTFKSMHTLPPVGTTGNEETGIQLTSSTDNEQTSTNWCRLLSCFDSSEGNKTEDSINDDALSYFVVHNVKNDLGEGKSNRGNSNDNKKEVDRHALLSKIKDLQTIIRALETKKSKQISIPRGKIDEEDARTASLNSEFEEMAVTLEKQIKVIVSESEKLDLEIGNVADDEIDSIVMEMALDGYHEDILGTNTEESDDTFYGIVSRLFNCKIGREESTSFSPNCSLISGDSESVVNEQEVPFHNRTRFEI